MRSLTKKSAAGMAWLLAQSGATRAIGFFAQLVLARLLRPSDFGIIALANSVVAMISALTSFGIDDVILSRSRKLRLWLAPAFWVSLSFSIIGATALVAASPIAARIYRSPMIIGLLAISATSMPLGALAAVPNACIRSTMKFRFIASYGTIELLAVQLTTILLAWSGFGPYSFVIPSPLAALVRAIVFWRVARPPVKWRVRRWQIKLLLRNGSAVFGQKLVTSLRENGDYMLLGVFASKSSVGLYFMAFKLAAMPVYTLVNSMYSVLFPGFAQLRGEPKRQLAAAFSTSRIIAFTVIPLSFLQAAVSAPLIHLFFGDRWLGAGPLLSILSIGLAFDVVPCITGALMSANGRFKEQWIFSIASIPLFLLLIGTGWFIRGTEGVAAGVALFFITVAPIYSYFATRPFGGSARDIAGIYLPPTLCAAIAVGGARLLSMLPLVRDQDVKMISITCTVSLVAYLLSSKWLSPIAMRDTMQKLSILMTRAA